MKAEHPTYLHALLDTVSDGIMAFDEHGTLIIVNRAAANLFGYCANELPGHHLCDLFPADRSANEWLAGSLAPSEHHYPRSRPVVGLRHDGSYFHADVCVQRFAWGDSTTIVVTLRDITVSCGKEASAEELDALAEAHVVRKLRQSEELLAFVLRVNPAIVYALAAQKPGAPIVYISPSVKDLLGYTPEEAMSTPGWWIKLLHPDDQENAMKVASTPIRDVNPKILTYRLRKKDGGYVWLQDQAILVSSDSGKPPIIGCLIDISERMRIEEEMMRTREAAVAASRVKSQFLANMSHEIRTPLHGVLGIAELLRDTPLSDEQKELLDMLRASGKTLNELIEDILDISKIEAGKLELDAAPFIPSEVLADSVRMVALRAREKGIELIADIAPSLSAGVIGDPVRFRQVVLNLLANAVKFTSRGEVALTARRSADKSIEITVRDTGIGVPVDRAEAIFEAFTQSDGSTRRRYGGTGLGLTICRELVEKMGGNIWYKSAEGGGSIFGFRVHLPCGGEGQTSAGSGNAGHAGAPALGADKVHDEGLVELPTGLRVLLAEDNEINALLMQRLLTRGGYEVVHVTTGNDAVAAWESERFDLVLMDVQMPEMDGLEATRHIRARERHRGGHVPIMALTANAMKEDEQTCLAAGMDCYLTKPVTPERLYTELAAMIRAYPPGK